MSIVSSYKLKPCLDYHVKSDAPLKGLLFKIWCIIYVPSLRQLWCLAAIYAKHLKGLSISLSDTESWVLMKWSSVLNEETDWAKRPLIGHLCLFGLLLMATPSTNIRVGVTRRKQTRAHMVCIARLLFWAPARLGKYCLVLPLLLPACCVEMELWKRSFPFVYCPNWCDWFFDMDFWLEFL